MKSREQQFKCRLCRRRVPWSFGCDDEFPHLCDDCWLKVQPDPSLSSNDVLASAEAGK